MLMLLDVGFANMGWGMIDNGKPVDAGVIETEKSAKKSTRTADDYAHRSAVLAAGLADITRVHRPSGIIAELPSGGAQNASAMAQMNMATAIVATFAELIRMPAEWVTPNESKKALTGYRDAPKRMMMEAIVEMFGGDIIKKVVNCRKTKNCPNGKREDRTYVFCGKKFCEGKFEHIADAFSVYNLQRQGNLVKLFG